MDTTETQEDRAIRLNAEGANAAHADGRHDGGAPVDRLFWAVMGCVGCANRDWR